jgi:hypothetical protein
VGILPVGDSEVSQQAELFHLDVPMLPPGEKVSQQRRRTQLQQAAISEGRHPLSGALGYRLPLHPRSARERGAEGLTCGDCRYRVLVYWHDRKYPKCTLGYQHEDAARPDTPPRMSHGAGTDVRRWWPACQDFEPGDRISDDAARWMPDLQGVAPGRTGLALPSSPDDE